MNPLHTRKKILETRKQLVDGVALIWRRYVAQDGKVRQSWELDDLDYQTTSISREKPAAFLRVARISGKVTGVFLPGEDPCLHTEILIPVFLSLENRNVVRQK